MGKNIVFTGGTGKAGRHVVQYLVEHGYNVLNLDLKPLAHPKVRTLITDITDSGQVFNALTSSLEVHEFAPSLRAPKIDAIVHFAAIPRIMIVPDNEVFRINTMGTYNIIEAAEKLGIARPSSPLRKPPTAWCSPTSRATRRISRSTRSIRSTRWTATPCPRSATSARRTASSSERRRYLRHPDRQRDPNRTNTPTSRNSLPTRVSASASPGSYIEAREPGPDRPPRHRKGRAGLPDLQRRAERLLVRPADRRVLRRFYPNVPVHGELGEFESLLSNPRFATCWACRAAQLAQRSGREQARVKERVGCIGLGLMGHGIARNILEKGWPLAVLAHRKREAVDDLVGRGATEVASPRAMAESCDSWCCA